MCRTCNGTIKECPGHFGVIVFKERIYHYEFMKTVVKVLQCICPWCGKLRGCGAEDKNDEFNSKYEQCLRIKSPRRRLEWLSCLLQKVSTCKGCNRDLPDSIRKNGLEISFNYKENHGAEDQKGKTFSLDAEAAYYALNRIGDDTCRALGFDPANTHPKWMILKMLPVPPPAIRPAVYMGNVARGQDDLTQLLRKIVIANNDININEDDMTKNQRVKALTYEVACYFDNSIPGYTPESTKQGRPFKSLRARLKGKDGRIRGNLMGKRVNYSARSVITPDPNLEIDQVGVPRSIAENLTYPEVVTKENCERLQRWVDDRQLVNFIEFPDGTQKNLALVDGPVTIYPQCVLHRKLQDDDLVIFNRQPSLHKMSMMAHRVKILPYSSFRLNLSVTTPYNADFDGDEMNLHVPQSIESKAELKHLMMVPKQIITPRGNVPIMGIVQDTLVGSYLLTRKDAFIRKDMLMHLVMQLDNPNKSLPVPAVVKPEPLWTGKQVFSMFFPHISYEGQYEWARLFTPGDREGRLNVHLDEQFLVVLGGELLTGYLEKKSIGPTGGKINHITFLEGDSGLSGPDACKAFLSQTQRVVNTWLLQRGFTVGLGDAIASPETYTKIQTKTEESINNAVKIVENARLNKLDQKPGYSMLDTMEYQINDESNKAVNTTGEIVKESLKLSNQLLAMVTSGSKGNNQNIAQMVGCIGQQNVEGKRIPYHFYNRTLPHFTKDDYTPLSRGFVKNSYLRGLTPQEFFFHTMAGREGLIDTAVKTADTGYTQHKLVKCMEDVRVQYDATVRSQNGTIFQFIYGEDGMDAASIEQQSLGDITVRESEFTRRYRVLSENGEVSPELASELRDTDEFVDEEAIAAINEEFRQLCADREQLTAPGCKCKGNLPVNIKRLILTATQQFHIDKRRPSELKFKDVILETRALLRGLHTVEGTDAVTREVQAASTELFGVLVRMNLASKRVIAEYHLTAEAFEWILKEISVRFYQSFATPGDAVGPIASQSLGELVTQMTLNTFHHAGVSSQNVTLGVPRLRELLELSSTPKGPTMSVYLESDFEKSEEERKTVAVNFRKKIQRTRLRDYTDTLEVYFDPDDDVLIEDQNVVSGAKEIGDGGVEKLGEASPWLVRIVLNQNVKGAQEGNTQNDIRARIEETYPDKLIIIVNDNKLAIRIKFKNRELTLDEVCREAGEMLDKVVIGGLQNVGTVYIDCQPYTGKREGVRLDKDGKLPNEFILQTDGTNLYKALAVPGVDATRTRSNCIHEILQVFGIEAVRQALFSEITTVLSAYGAYVNYRHLALLCDVMTNTSELCPISRHGMAQSGAGPLSRCSFEETLEQLVQAAAFSEYDDLHGVSASIMLGQTAPLGTGFFDVLLDVDQLMKVEHSKDEEYQEGVPTSVASPQGSPVNFVSSPRDFVFSPVHSVESPTSPSSPRIGAESPAYSPTSPSNMSSPTYSPSSPAYSPSSPAYSPSSPAYSPSSPAYSPSSPAYSPSSPAYSPSSPAYSPSSPAYSPSSPAYSPSSPAYSPSSPAYSPSSPAYSPSSPAYSPSSPAYSPSSPAYSPSSPAYSPSSPAYSPSSPAYSPSSPAYSPSSPAYSPSSPAYSPSSPAYSPLSPAYSPSSN